MDYLTANKKIIVWELMSFMVYLFFTLNGLDSKSIKVLKNLPTKHVFNWEKGQEESALNPGDTFRNLYILIYGNLFAFPLDCQKILQNIVHSFVE